MEPYTRNGGIIGKKRKYGTSVIPIVSQTYSTIEYVGGRTQAGAGTTANISVALTGLAGGLATAPAAGDLVIVSFATGAIGTQADITYRISTYTQIADLYGNDSYDVNLQVGYKIMGATPDTTATITAGSGSTSFNYTVTVSVWRGIDPITPFDVTSTTAILLNTGIPNPAAITPVTPGARIVVTSATAHVAGVGTFGAAYLSNFLTVTSNGSYDSTIGTGHVSWTSGAYDPAAWTTGFTDAATYSTASVTMALRPLIVTVFGNKQNTGIWDLATTSTAPTIAANNVFPQPRDIFSWCSTATLNGCTISQDTTIVSPFNNTPLKMTITGNSDPYILTTGAATWNIAAAAVGQTWEFSVWAMTDLATSGELYIFEANSGHVWVQVSSYTMPLKKYWKQFKVRRTFTDATTAFVQVRLDGQNTGGSGYSIWFDGLQVRRIV